MKEITTTENNEVITLDKTKLNSFKSELTKVTKSMTKLSKLAYELASTPATKKLFIEEVGKMGMSRATAYALINAGHAIDTRKSLENTEYSKVAEIGKIDSIEDNIEVFEGEIETPIEEYAGKKTQKEIRNDVKNFNKYGTIKAPTTEESEPDATESEPEQDTTETPSNISKLAQAFKLLESVFESEENEEIINLVKYAMDYVTEATSRIEIIEREDNTNE